MNEMSFDAVLRQQKADVWDEGWKAACHYYAAGYQAPEKLRGMNPYRRLVGEESGGDAGTNPGPAETGETP